MGEGGTVHGRVAALIVVTAAIRLAVGALVGLSVDESYAVVLGRRLALSYYDHPPLVFWLSGLAARLGGESEAVVRLPFVLMFMGTTWLLYRLAAFVADEPAGLWAAVCLNLTLFFSWPAASWILPDGPLLLFSAAAALNLSHAVEAPPSPGAARSWLAFGAFSGLALLSKYHAVFLLFGAALYLTTSPRHRFWLWRPEPLCALLTAGVVFLPVIIWNAQNGWASLRFQAGRAIPQGDGAGSPLVDMLLGQSMWMLPWIWLPLALSLAAALRRGPRDPRGWLLACLAIGPIVLFTLLAAMGMRGLPHWPAPGYFFLLPLLGRDLAQCVSRGSAWVKPWAWGSVAGLALIVAVAVVQVRLSIIDRIAPHALLRGDPTDDLVPWRPVAEQLARWGYPRSGATIAGATWADTAKLSYALGPRVAATSVGPDPRGFDYVLPQATLVGQDILIVARRGRGREPMVSFAPYFEGILALGTIDLAKGGRRSVAVSVYVGHRLLRPVPRRPGR